MNIQTMSLSAVLADFEKTQRSKMNAATGETRAYYEGSAETLKMIRTQMVPALENTFVDIVEETELKTVTPDELREHEQRMREILDAPRDRCEGDEWKNG